MTESKTEDPLGEGLILRWLRATLLPTVCGAAAALLQVRPLAEVQPSGSAAKWLATGGQPRLELVSPVGGLPSGWVLLRGRLLRQGTDYTTRLLVEVEGGRQRRLEYPVPVTLKGAIKELVWLPPAVTRLEFQPMGSTGAFELGELSLSRVNALEALMLRWRRVRHAFIRQPRVRRERVGLYWYTPLLALKKAYALAGLLRGHGPTLSYDQWVAEVADLTREDRRRIRRDVRRWSSRPRLRMLVIAGGGELDALRITLESVRRQLYLNVQVLVIAPREEVAAVRVAVGESDWLCVQAQDALPATGAPVSAGQDWWISIPPGAALAEHALYWLASAALSDLQRQLLYCDHDYLDAGGNRVDPEFKPDWSLELLRSSNYIGAAAAVRSDLAAAVLACPAEALPSALAATLAEGGRHDWLLRCTERLAGREIHHLPGVLLHLPQRAAVANSIGPVTAHLRRLGIPAEVGYSAKGHSRVRYALPAPAPLVSLIVPTRDALHHLRACVESVLAKSSYRNFELLVVDNQSAEPDTLRYLAELQTRPQVRVLNYALPFNFSAINNFAAGQARGEALCLLNNDTEVITPDWLEEMLAHLVQPDVGVVGAKLFFSDGRVQHAGDTVGPGGCAHHLHSFLAHDAPGYCGRAVQAQDLSAVTGACLLTWRKLYLELGGLDEVHLPVAFNDVDYCLRVREAKRRVVWTPYAELFHHESVSRGKDDSPEKTARAKREADYMRRRWEHVMQHDPFYNPNLSYERPDFSLNPVPVSDKPWLSR
jgi:GT2 family glycosyltransferase